MHWQWCDWHHCVKKRRKVRTRKTHQAKKIGFFRTLLIGQTESRHIWPRAVFFGSCYNYGCRKRHLNSTVLKIDSFDQIQTMDPFWIFLLLFSLTMTASLWSDLRMLLLSRDAMFETRSSVDQVKVDYVTLFINSCRKSLHEICLLSSV